MPLPAISAENLSKCYLVGRRSERDGHHTELREVIKKEVSNALRKAVNVMQGQPVVQGDFVEEYWALKDVSFEVHQGEVFGIIGRNGAGKSTLLKILSRITEPTCGRVTLRGRTASLLEVGTGFQPELSGRENIFLNGAILGMRRGEIHKKFDEIVAFAEVEKFIDTPVKRYSSGMYVRLAFAVAAHLEPEILIVDEVLAVGDTEFQKKCLGKMDEVSRREGRTVLFVSHHMGTVINLCSRAIWLDHGSIQNTGPVREIATQYLSFHQEKADCSIKLADVPRPYNGNTRLRLEQLDWISQWPLSQGNKAVAKLTLIAEAAISDFAIGILFRNIEGAQLMECNSDLIDRRRPLLPRAGRYCLTLEIEALPLAPGFYTLDLGCRSGEEVLDYLPGCAQIDVVPSRQTLVHTIRRGAGVQLPAKWSTVCEITAKTKETKEWVS
jgi:lipopolysaccharide transport system ATP-binding protein